MRLRQQSTSTASSSQVILRDAVEVELNACCSILIDVTLPLPVVLLDPSSTSGEMTDNLGVSGTHTLLAQWAEKVDSGQSASWGNVGNAVARGLALEDGLMRRSSPWWSLDHYWSCLRWTRVAKLCWHCLARRLKLAAQAAF